MRLYFLLRLTASVGFLFLLGLLLSAFAGPHTHPAPAHTTNQSLSPEAGQAGPPVTDLVI